MKQAEICRLIRIGYGERRIAAGLGIYHLTVYGRICGLKKLGAIRTNELGRLEVVPKRLHVRHKKGRLEIQTFQPKFVSIGEINRRIVADRARRRAIRESNRQFAQYAQADAAEIFKQEDSGFSAAF